MYSPCEWVWIAENILKVMQRSRYACSDSRIELFRTRLFVKYRWTDLNQNSHIYLLHLGDKLIRSKHRRSQGVQWLQVHPWARTWDKKVHPRRIILATPMGQRSRSCVYNMWMLWRRRHTWRMQEGGQLPLTPLPSGNVVKCFCALFTAKRSVDELSMHYFHHLQSWESSSLPRSPPGLHRGSHWQTFVPKALICHPWKKIPRAPTRRNSSFW